MKHLAIIATAALALSSATAAFAAPAPDLAALAAENAARAAALEKAAEEARLFAETNVFEEVEAPIIEGDIAK